MKLVAGAAALLGAFAAFAIAPIALAQGVGVGVNANVNATVGGADASVRASATGTANMDSATSNAGGAATGTQMRVENRSEVSARVQALLQAADRDGGIGADIRAVANEYASSSERAAEAKAEVESRPGWLTFIIGTDYGNLGRLRSEIATTENHIQRLTNAMDRSTDASVKADLQAQIDVLEAQASATAEFVVENESKFSVFGWFFRIFQ